MKFTSPILVLLFCATSMAQPLTLANVNERTTLWRTWASVYGKISESGVVRAEDDETTVNPATTFGTTAGLFNTVSHIDVAYTTDALRAVATAQSPVTVPAGIHSVGGGFRFDCANWAVSETGQWDSDCDFVAARNYVYRAYGVQDPDPNYTGEYVFTAIITFNLNLIRTDNLLNIPDLDAMYLRGEIKGTGSSIITCTYDGLNKWRLEGIYRDENGNGVTVDDEIEWAEGSQQSVTYQVTITSDETASQDEVKIICGINRDLAQLWGTADLHTHASNHETGQPSTVVDQMEGAVLVDIIGVDRLE